MTRREWARMGFGVAVALALGHESLAAATPEEAAKASAEAWLALVDQGKYAESWAAGAQIFKGAITAQRWKEAIAGVRGPLGKVVSRKLKSSQSMTSLPGAPDGRYVVIQYETAFEHKSAAVETIMPTVDPDGAWRVSGYFVR